VKVSILSLNAGSANVKFSLFDAADDSTATLQGEIADLDSTPHITARDAARTVSVERRLPPGFHLALQTLLDFVDDHLGRDGLTAIPHRIVHGGANNIAPELKACRRMYWRSKAAAMSRTKNIALR
jgi:acetate kinase